MITSSLIFIFALLITMTIIDNLSKNKKGGKFKRSSIPQQYKKNRHTNTMKQNIKKGKDYEKFIGKLFEDNGYIVKYNGIEQGRKDSSIDIIAIKGNQIILTQCKNWKLNSRYKINHEKIKAFIGDSYNFILKNQQYRNYKIKRLFCVANDVFDASAKNYMKSNKDIIEYRIISPNYNHSNFEAA